MFIIRSINTLYFAVTLGAMKEGGGGVEMEYIT